MRDHRGRVEAVQVEVLAAAPARGLLDDAGAAR